MRKVFYLLAVMFLFLPLASCRGKAKEAGKPMQPGEHEAVEGKQFDCQGAGKWFPGSKEELITLVDRYLAAAKRAPAQGKIVALISPHAGFIYSGPVAAAGYKQLQGTHYDVVVVIGFSHSKAYPGISVLSEETQYETPLGPIPIDTKLGKELISLSPSIKYEPELFRGEHSMENQLPFLQRALKSFRIVPVMMGAQTPANSRILADALAHALKGKNALIVASTDMSHFYGYDEAKQLDAEIISLVEKKDAAGVERLMSNDPQGRRLCGHGVVAAVLEAVKKLGADQSKLMRYANSGDITGDSSQGVVGYMSVALINSKLKPEKDKAAIAESAAIEELEKGELNKKDQEELLRIARVSLETYINTGKQEAFKAETPALDLKRGVFVTLMEHDQLRGCMGYFEQDTPLYKLVSRQAIVSATGDPRFPRVSPDELKDIHIEISVLSPPRKVNSYEDIVVGRHGVILQKGANGATFLPQVAPEQGWDRDTMLTHLAQKAGLPPDAWRHGATFMVYTAQVFSEEEK